MKKFEFIYSDIKNKIESGFYTIGNFLPNENELAKHYQVSRETLRKAQKILEDEGYIKKIHGQGAIVLDISKLRISSNSITSFSKLSSKQNGNLQTKVLKHRIDILKEYNFGYNEVKNELGIAVERIRLLKNEPVIFDRDFFLQKFVGNDIPEKFLLSSVYDYFENELGLKISLAQKDITIERPSVDIRMLLDMKSDSHVAVTRSTVYLENMNLFQVHESFQKVDTFHLFDIARR